MKKTIQEKANLLKPLADHLFERAKFLKANPAPQVRWVGGLPLSVASAAAIEIIVALEGRLNFLPVMLELLTELLDVKAYRARESRSPEARDAALYILALLPDTGTNELALMVGVNKSTISKWNNNPAFKDELRKIKKEIADPRWRSIVEKALLYLFSTDE